MKLGLLHRSAKKDAPRPATNRGPLTQDEGYKALHREIEALAAREDPTGPAFQQSLLGLLAEHLRTNRQKIHDDLNEGARGLKTAKRLCRLVDQVVMAAFQAAVEFRFVRDNPTEGEKLSLIAVGGYGRGTMAPFSDVDLLFLLPYRQTDWTESVIEFVLYLLWDLKLKVGHAVRSVAESLHQASLDMTIHTTLLECRFLCGDKALYKDLDQRFWSELVAGDEGGFVEAKLAEREARHERTGQSRYQVEPNVKEGKGGFRDLHSLFWITRYLFPGVKTADLVALDVLGREDLRRFRRAEEFLWWVRCHMHFIAGRAEERLDFDLQQSVASHGGYANKTGMKAVERFMRRYFMVARDVGNLTRTICAALELRSLKGPSPFSRLMGSFKKTDQSLKAYPDLTLSHGRITPVHMDRFADNAYKFIEVFQAAQESGLSIHPTVLQAVSRKVKSLSPSVRKDPDVNARFLAILTNENDPEPILRRLNETGFLGAFMPSFGKIVGMMQFNMYHHYTVDEHQLLAVKFLHRIEKGVLDEAHPLVTKLVHNIKHRRALYVAVLIHDIAKGRPEDHSIAGAKVARRLCPRLGLSAVETNTVAWLVEHHLLMSDIAQRRDLSDPKTIQDFADVVQTIERLNLLLILTVCDIQAVGPGTWNGWKGQLLRVLYHETEPLLSGGFAYVSDQGGQAAFAREMESRGWPSEKIDQVVKRLYSPYWRRVPLERQIAQVELLAAYDAAPDKIHTDVRTDAFQGITEISFVTADHNRLLSMIAGACAAIGASIVDAQIYTSRDGLALHSVGIARGLRSDDDEAKRTRQLIKTFEKALRGEMRLHDLVLSRRKPKARHRPFKLAAEVTLNNTYSDTFSVIEVNGLDRTGLLYDLMVACNQLSIRLASAHITTYGEQAVDVFYVTDLTGKKIYDPERREQIEALLLKTLIGTDGEKPHRIKRQD